MRSATTRVSQTVYGSLLPGSPLRGRVTHGDASRVVPRDTVIDPRHHPRPQRDHRGGDQPGGRRTPVHVTDIARTFNLDQPRPPKDWPDVTPGPCPRTTRRSSPSTPTVPARTGTRHGMPRPGGAARPHSAHDHQSSGSPGCRGTRGHPRCLNRAWPGPDPVP